MPSASETFEARIPVCREGTRLVRMQTVMAATSTSHPTKPIVECPSFPEVDAVAEVTAMVTYMDNIQSHEEPSSASNKNVDDFAAQMATTTEVEVESIVSSISDESAALQGHNPNDVNVSLSTKSDESSVEDPDYDKQTVLVAKKLLQDQVKLEGILDVFGQCVQCGSKCIITMENQINSCCKNLHLVFSR